MVSSFKSGEMSIDNYAHSSPPSTVQTNENIKKNAHNPGRLMVNMEFSTENFK